MTHTLEYNVAVKLMIIDFGEVIVESVWESSLREPPVRSLVFMSIYSASLDFLSI